MPAAVYCWFLSFGPLLPARPSRVSPPPEPDAATHVRVDATDRPILTGMMAVDSHSHVD